MMSKSNPKQSWYQRLGRWILENRIKAQLKMRLPTVVQEDGIIVVNPSSPLFSWLSLAKLCSVENDANLLGYQFSNNQSLAAFLIAEQESFEAKITVKQNTTLNFTLLYSTQNQGEKLQFNPIFSFFQRLFKWCFMKALQEGGGIHFDKPTFIEEVVLTRLRNMSEKLPQEENQHAPGQHIIHTHSLNALLFKDPSLSSISLQEEHPMEEDPNFARIIEIDVNQEIEKTDALEIQTDNDISLEVAQDIGEEQIKEQQLWVDQSQLLNSSEIRSLFNLNQTLQPTCYWLFGLEETLAKSIEGKNEKLRFTVSEHAKKMLISAGGYIDTNHLTFDSERLPLGFFIDKINSHHFSLKYDDNLRAHQIKIPHLASLRLDPKENNGRQAYLTQRNQTEINSFSQLENRRKLTYSLQQRQFFNALDQKEIVIQMCYSLNDIFYKALDKIHNDSANTDEQVYQFIDAMITMNGQTISHPNPNSQITTKFQFFTRYFLYNLTEGSAFFSPAAWEYLNRFIKEKNSAVLLLFFTFLNSGIRSSYNDDFLQTARRVYYLCDYLEQQGIPIEPDPRFQAEVFNQPELLMECITQIKNNHPLLLPWVGKHISYFPRDLVHAKALLDAGYSFLHRSMNIATWNSEAWIPAKISEQELIKVVKPDERRAYFLRYLATEVADSQVLELLAFWEKTIGSLDELVYDHRATWGRKLNNYWPDIVSRLLKAPTCLSNESATAETKTIMQVNGIRSSYDLKDLEELCSSFASQTDFPENEWLELIQNVQLLNGKMTDCSKLSSEDIVNKSANLKNKFDKIEALALMREIHYRITYHASNSQPKQGQWLRLEQLLAILIAYKHPVSLEIETSEGKTLIVGWTALLKALSNQKGSVLSHNQTAAKDAAQALANLANLFKVNVGYKDKPSAIEKEDIDILFADISTMVLSDLQNGIPVQRKKQYVFLDEGDNIILDIQADTTFQLSEGIHQADEVLVSYLISLNNSVRMGQEMSLAQLKVTHPQCGWGEDEFNFWLQAAKSAAKLKRNVDYVVQTDANNKQCLAVYIVHKKTTGNVDKISKWSDGLHSCVAAFERTVHANVIVPGVSLVQKKGDVYTHLKSYKQRALFTGTFGGKNAIELINKVVKSSFCLKFPRAKRPVINKEFAAWPLVATKQEGGKFQIKSVYSRAYHFTPMLCSDDATHKTRLLQAVRAVQEQNNSALFLFNTIEECEIFADFLRDNAISDSKIQIFDDARDENAATENPRRPDEKTIRLRSSEPKMITIGTARAGRAEDFPKITYCFICKIDSGRGLRQKAGRVARNMNLGVIYEIYSLEDQNSLRSLEDQNSLRALELTKKNRFFQEGISILQEKMEKNMVEQINKKSVFS